MIVRICDHCKKILEDDCMIVALRDDSKQTIVFKKGNSTGRVSGHLCNNACASLFFEKWLEGALPPMPDVPVQEVPSQPSKVHVVDLREPTPQEQAEQNALLSSVIGRG